MKKTNKKKILILIVLMFLIIAEVVAFQFSKAKDSKEIEATIVDKDSLIEDEKLKIEAKDEGKSGYSITLPDVVNDKAVESYQIEEKEIKDKKKECNNEESEQSDNKELNIGEKVYLTDEELKSNTIKLKVKYDKKETNNSTLYNRKIETEVGENSTKRTITIIGFMPIDAEIKVQEIKNEDIAEATKDYTKENVNLKVAYDIKILSGDKEYEPSDFDENVRVSINNVEKTDAKYRVLHIDENKTEEVNDVEKTDNSICFDAKHFSVYAILSDDTQDANQVSTNDQISTMAIASYAATNTTKASIYSDKWDGNISDKFEYGDGSTNNPYLIKSCGELAYLAQQVNNGNSFDGKNIQLIVDIDLDNKEWTPIGNNTNSFKGIFDGCGHKISNANINTTSEIPYEDYYSYGFFGTIGTGNAYTIIRNVEFNNIKLSLKASGEAYDDGGFCLGIVAGKIYNKAKIENVIANGCEISNSSTITIETSGMQLFIGGLVGMASNTSSSESDPGTNARYSIDNCFANVNISIDAELGGWWGSTKSYAGQYAAGGIIGAIRSQPVYPTNCLYTGNVNAANGFTGPIFGYLRNSSSYTSTNNFAKLWYGTDAGTVDMTSYYSNYSTNDKSYTSSYTSTSTPNSTTYRNSTSTRNMTNEEGMNKGTYTSDISSRLSSFNSKYSDDAHTKWVFENNNYSFLPRMSVEVNSTNDPTYTLSVTDNYVSNPTYTYKWFINNNLDSSVTGNSITKNHSWDEDYKIKILIGDGKYYTFAEFTIVRYEIHIEFTLDKANNKVTANLAGTALPYINKSDYTYKWYTQDIAGLSTDEIPNKTSATLDNLEDGMDYKVVATNNSNSKLSAEDSFTYGNRTVVYLDYNNGSDYNDGTTPSTPVETMSKAYSKLNSSARTMNSNVIVVMGDYTNGSYFNSATATAYAKKATLTGIYNGTNYNGTLYFQGDSTYKYLNEDTGFQYLELRGSTSSYGSGQVYFYGQGFNINMGEGLKMTRYSRANTNQGLITGNAPGFHLICGWLRYDRASLPRNNATINIKSGTYGRIILGGSSGTNSVSNMSNYTSHNFTGSSSTDDYTTTINIDIKNSTTPSDYTYDINLLVGGSAWGNEYANVTENIKNGNIGRVLGASIGDSSTRPSNWNYPINTFLGETTINMLGGHVKEMYGGCLGRNMSALSGSSDDICDSYYYGKININVNSGNIDGNIYGAGAGGVTGYNTSSTDQFKSYGKDIDTSVNINVNGGTIGGNIYRRRIWLY